jgi:non-specific serine/threonine protein kinase
VASEEKDKRYASPDSISDIPAILHLVCACLPLSPTAALKRLATRKQMSKKAILRSDRKVERGRKSPSDCSILSTHDDFLFLHQNDYWIIRYRGRTALLKSTRGLHCLAVLLHDPGREFHVRDLLSLSVDVSIPVRGAVLNGRARREPHAGIPMLDRKAKAEYQRRLNELRQELNEAERFKDPQRQAQAQNEVQAIADCLASAVGLGGRDRQTSSDAERARSAVTKCVKNAIQRIGVAIPLLGYHLAARIKTGYFCSYHPHPDRHITWKF